MQIHELNTLGVTPGETDYLAIDTGFDTAKISAPNLLKPIKEQADQKINLPRDEHNQPDNGTAGQLLRTNGDGTTEWVDEGLPTDEQTEEAINKWLDDHPEATTTVADGSLTESKFSSDLKLKTIKNYVTPEMFGAVGDGITDDTIAFRQLDGKNVLLLNKTYRISSVTYGHDTNIVGINMGTSIIKQLPNVTDDMITFLNADCSSFRNVTLLGNFDKSKGKSWDYDYQALLKIRTDSNNRNFTNYSLFEHIVIRDADVNGLVVSGIPSNWGMDTRFPNNYDNWVHQFNDFRIENCGRYCLVDQASDNRFSNFYLSEGNQGCAFINASANMYVNFKLDQPYGGGEFGDENSYQDGALLIIVGSACLRMVNFDLQSGYYAGAKVSWSWGIEFDGDINNCGIGTQNGIGLLLYETRHSNFNVECHNVNYIQKYNAKILTPCENISCFIKSNNNGLIINECSETCFVADSSLLAPLLNTKLTRTPSFTNKFNAPLVQSGDYYYGANIELDTTSQIAGTNSFLINGVIGQSSYVAQSIGELNPNHYYICGGVVKMKNRSSDPDAPITAHPYLTIVNSQTAAELPSIKADEVVDPDSTEKQVIYKILKPDSDGYMNARIFIYDSDAKAYVGNFICADLTEAWLSSSFRESNYELLHEYLVEHASEAFTKIIYQLDVRDVMGVINKIIP